MSDDRPVLLAIDGNSLAHRSFHALAGTGLRTSDGRASWAVKGFVSQLLSVVERVGPAGLVVGFDDPSSSVRRQQYPDYKATRKPKPPELTDQLAGIAELLRAAGVHVVTPAGLEADDVLASAAAAAAAAGWRCTIATSDRDSFALIDSGTSVLRILNGGVDASPTLTPERLVTMYGIRPDQYRLYAAIRGDSSDNLPGVVGVGEKTAAKLLAQIQDVDALLGDLDAGGAGVLAAVGKFAAAKFVTHRPALERNLSIMAMYRDVPLHLDLAGGPGCLPLAAGPLAAALAGWELHSVAARAAALLTASHSDPYGDPQPPAGPVEETGELTLWDHLTPDLLEPATGGPVSVARTQVMGSSSDRPSRWPLTL